MRGLRRPLPQRDGADAGRLPRRSRAGEPAAQAPAAAANTAQRPPTQRREA